MKNKRISIIISAILFGIYMSILPVMAEDIKTGSLIIRLPEAETGLAAELSIVKVADNINGEFQIKDKFSQSKVDLNNIQNGEEYKNAATKLVKIAKPDKTIATDINGVAKIQNLTSGVYLVYDFENDSDQTISPFLVSVPMCGEENSIMLYDIEVFPKCSAVQKVDVPKTGDSNDFTLYGEYLILGILLMGMSCICFGVARLKK